MYLVGHISGGVQLMDLNTSGDKAEQKERQCQDPLITVGFEKDLAFTKKKYTFAYYSAIFHLCFCFKYFQTTQ